MNLATWSIRTPIPSVMLFIMMTAAGLLGFRNLPIQNFPDMDLPTVTVSLALTGAAPTQLETEAARRTEDAIASLQGLKHIYTQITDGVAAVTAEFVLEKPLSDALIETKDAVDSVRADLPEDMLPPVVAGVKISSAPLVTYAVTSDKMSEEELSWYADDVIGRAMLLVKGAGKFERIGGVAREIRVVLDPVKAASLGVTAADLSQAIRLTQMESSGGRADIGGQEQAARVAALADSAQSLRELYVTTAAGRRIRLDQVALVEDSIAERSAAAILNGKRAVGFNVFGSKGSDETKVVAAAEKKLEELRAKRPDVTFTRIASYVDYTLQQYHGSMDMLYEGALLAVIVVALFLRDWRATIISAAALPLSIIPTFAAMHWLGFSLNTITLLAQSVVAGILVDDAIVEVENIMRHKAMGKPLRQAAEDAVTEIAVAVIATTFTLVSVFLPTAFMSGVTGLFFRQFGWTIVISVLISLLVARLLTPVMAVYWLKDTVVHHEEKDGPFMRTYLVVVRWCMHHKLITFLLTFAFFGLSIHLAGQLPTGFIPASDRGFTTVHYELPPGTPVEKTIAVGLEMEKAARTSRWVTGAFVSVGSGHDGGGGHMEPGEARKGSIILTLTPRGTRPDQSAVENEIRQALSKVPGARFSITGGGPGEKLMIFLTGDNIPALKAASEQLTRAMRDVKGLNNIVSTASIERPEIFIRPDNAAAAELGVSTRQLGDLTRTATAGDFSMILPKLNLDNRQVYIRTRLSDADLADPDMLANLRVGARGGAAMTPVATVAAITEAAGPAKIDRYDRNRYVSVSADLGGAPLGEALEKVKALPAMKTLPGGVKVMETGDAEIMAELFTGFGMAILTGVACVFCVLVLLFKDFIQPVTILSALPLSFGGSFMALLMAHQQMGLPALIGLVMLMGVVTKNSILLVEYTITGMRERGLNDFDAALDACHKRARPIIMTTIAMIAGMAPVALGIGGDSSFRKPMAIAVIGGLITSTALSLFAVPVTFLAFKRGSDAVGRLFGGKKREGSDIAIRSE